MIFERYGKNDVLTRTKDICDSWLSDFLESFVFILILPNLESGPNSRIRAAFEAKLGARRGIVLEGAQAEQLLNLYSLYAFTDKLIIGSFDLPPGRRLRNLLQSGVATEEELIQDIILGAM
jgi:hypothetical protein